MSALDPVETGIAIAGTLQLAKQGQDLIAALAGRKGESLGTILGDIGRRRIDNIEAVGNKAHLVLLNIGVTRADAVALNVLYPLLEGASQQEGAELQEIWANMLANAASPLGKCPVLPSFPAILKELASADVKFLDLLVNQAEEYSRHASPCPPLSSVRFDSHQLQKAFNVCGLGSPVEGQPADMGHAVQWRDDESWTISVVMDTLHRNGLIERSYYVNDGQAGDPLVISSTGASLTELAIRFVMACRIPRGR